MYRSMTATKGERVHIRIDDDLKEGAIAVARLRGLGGLTSLITTLLKEEVNQEIQTRPELFADELKKVTAEIGGIKQSVPVGLPANVADRNHVKRNPQKSKTLTRKTGRKR